MRSWLFVPGDKPDRFAKALGCGADAIILDLEDGVAEAKRQRAIANVDAFLKYQSPEGPVGIWVRVDDSLSRRPEIEDLAAHASLDGFVIPKFESREQCQGWQKPVMAIIETPLGIVNAAQITLAAAENLHGIALGPEDLCAALGIDPSRESMLYPASAVIFAANAAGVCAYSCPGSISEYRDLDAWRATLRAGRRIGSHGALCIHPAQIESANLAFCPTRAEIEWATAVVAAWEQAEGEGAIAVDGKMVDRPVVARARLTIARQHPMTGPALANPRG